MYCGHCGQPRPLQRLSCDCGCWVFVPSLSSNVELGAEPPSVLRGPIASVANMPDCATLLLYGRRGVGKSTLALQAVERPAVISTEMSAEQVVRYATRLGVHVVCVAPVVATQGEDGRWDYSWPYEAPEAGGLVVDSVNGVADPVGFFRWVRAEADRRGLPLVLTGQVTTEGTLRSGTSIPHEVDVVVQLTPSAGGVVMVSEKNRFGPLRSAVWRAQQQDRRYVVTGGQGDYALGVWPWTSSEVYDDYDAKLINLPPAPTAVAARRTRRDGYVDPEDVAERAAFAEAAGVTFLDAVQLNQRRSGDESHNP